MGMTPIYFEGRFGWIHDTGTRAPSAMGVILCPAFAQEEVCTHYGLMDLAERLAGLGMPVIRFDYRGTGDSIADEPAIETMIADIALAADCLRQQCGVGTVALAGVRLGAALALQAATSIAGVGAIALIAPVLSGQAFMRETRAGASVASLSGLEPVMPLDSGLPLVTNGFRWSGALQQAVAAIDLAAMPAPACPVLVIPARGDRRPAKIAARWRDGGAEITELPFPDYETWMQDPTTNETPDVTFAAVTEWMAAITPPATETLPGRAVPIVISHQLTQGGTIEQPVRFGPDKALFGILARPAQMDAAPVAALLLHQGSTHHIGNGGAYVQLARRLAESGVASLRMDLSGMGDSPAGDNARHPHYDPERIAEGIAGVDLLDRSGFPQAVVFGLCSGAHTALQVTLADERVIGNIVLNLQKFIWHYGADIRIATRDNKRSLKGYIRAMRNPGEWRRALAGEADLKGIARVLTKRAITRTTHAARSLLPVAPDSETAQVRWQMRTLAERGTFTHLVFSDEDPGLAEMRMQFGRKARRLAAFKPAQMIVFDRADHHFNGQEASRRHLELAETVMTAVNHGQRAMVSVNDTRSSVTDRPAGAASPRQMDLRQIGVK